MERPSFGVDVIGDIHGQLAALESLVEELGYDADGSHPEDRRLLFVGDLVDRGPASYEVSRWVADRCAEGRALCLLGNHELNLVEWRAGRTKPKASNRATIEQIESRPERWDPLLAFFETLPLAVELPGLRVTHAVWHQGCFDALVPALGSPGPSPMHTDWAPYVRLHAAYAAGAFREGMPTERFSGQWEKALEVFVKGYEHRAAEPFTDNDGVVRDHVRAQWWLPERDEVPRDVRIVFGHYWNMPPVPGVHDAFVPPHPSGHPRLRAWLEGSHASVTGAGRRRVADGAMAVCVDFNGVTRAGERACVGAYRYPESEVVWVCR